VTEIEKNVILTAGDCSYHIKARWGKSRKGLEFVVWSVSI